MSRSTAPEPIRLVVRPNGTIVFVYDDRLRGLIDQGRATIARASHVEPTPEGSWTADLGPSGGPVLGPFRERHTALVAERRWLDTHLLKGHTPC